MSSVSISVGSSSHGRTSSIERRTSSLYRSLLGPSLACVSLPSSVGAGGLIVGLVAGGRVAGTIMA